MKNKIMPVTFDELKFGICSEGDYDYSQLKPI